MLKTLTITVSIFFLLFNYCFAEEKKPEEKLTSEIAEQIKKTFQITDQPFTVPEDKETENKTDTKAPETPKKPEPKTREIKPITPKPTGKKEDKKKEEETTKQKNLSDKALNFLFGKDPDTKPKKERKTEEIEEIKERGERLPTIKEINPVADTPIDESIKRAIENSPDIAKAKIEAEIIRRQNTFTPVPTFQVGNDLATGKTMISAGITLPLEPLFTGKQRERYGMLNIEQKKLEVERKVIEQYKTLSTLNKKLESRKKKYAHAKQLAMNADEQYKGGLIRLDELIKAKELLWQSETEVENITIDLEVEAERLKSIERGGR